MLQVFPHVRFLTRLDLPHLAAVERSSFAEPWSEEEASRCLGEPQTIGMAAALPGSPIVGFLIFEVQPHRVELLRVAVDPSWRRRGVGKALLAALADALTYEGIGQPIRIVVHDANLDAHQFFRSQGFRAERVLRRHFPDGDGYVFVYHPPIDNAAKSAG
jgi:ribosomal-protein-alanine N-acetyltransferase